MHVKWSRWIMWCACCIPLLLSGQTEAPAEETFFFHGFIDAAGEVSLQLKAQEERLSGHITYLSSGLSLDLEGQRENHRFHLRERNTQNQLCGHLEGQLLEKKFSGHWYNRDRSVGLPFLLSQGLAPVEQEKGCTEQRWVAGFAGALPGGEARLTLSRTPGTELSGAFYYAGLRRSWTLEQMPSTNPVKLVIKDEKGHPQGVLSVHDLEPGKEIEVHCEGLIDGRLAGTLKPETDWKGKCKAYWGYAVQYSVNYYAPETEALAGLLDAQATAWMSRCRRKVGGKEQDFQAAGDRARFRYDAWFEPTYVSPIFVSGLWQYQGPEEEKTEAVNFDLSRRRSIGWKDLFREGVKGDKLIRKKVRKAVKKRPEYKDKGFRKHLRKTSFDYFALQPDGLQVFSDFDPVYGRFSVLIRWEELEGKLAIPALVSKQF